MFEIPRGVIDPFTKALIGLDFDSLRMHCEFVKASLNDERERFESYANKSTKGLTKEQIADFYQFHDSEVWQVSTLFPSFQWMATFLLSYGMFEKALNDICHNVGKLNDLPLTLQDISGQGIERAKLYLSKGCSVSAPFNSKEWAEVQRISKIRNVIAHVSGLLDLDKNHHKEVFKIIQKDSAIIVNNHDVAQQTASIELTVEFNIKAIESFRSFLYLVCDTPRAGGTKSRAGLPNRSIRPRTRPSK